MSSGKRILFLCIFGLGAMALVWGIVRSRQSLEARTRRLPDGSRLTLKAVTYGAKRHKMRTRNHWKDYLVPFVSESRAQKLGCHFFATVQSSDAMAFWLVWDGFPAARPRLKAATFDEHGCEFQSASPVHTNYLTPANQLLVCKFRAFSRRTRNLGFRLYEQKADGSWFVLAEYEVPNPDKRTHPVWKAEPFPITKTVANVNFTLMEVKYGVNARTLPMEAARPGDHPGAYFKFRITENGVPAPAWDFAGVKELTDALGHVSGQGGYRSSRNDNGDCFLVIDSEICSEESAWKVDVEFAKQRDFSKEELWIVRSVPVPEEKAISQVEAATNLHGAQLWLHGVIGIGYPEPRERRSIASWPAVHVTYENPVAERELKLVEIVDDRGRPVSSGASVGGSPGSNYLFGLTLHSDSKSLDLSFAVTRKLALQYLAKPSRLTPLELEKLKRRYFSTVCISK